jgi:hypothetical protein
MKMVRATALTTLTAAGLALGALTGSPASAATARHPAVTLVHPMGYLGACHPWHDNSTFGGWCDGTGPNSYRAFALCDNGDYVYGAARWDGDRRGSYAYCSSVNSSLYEGGFDTWA